MTVPKRDPRALLATGGLLLIPLAALWLLVSPRLSRTGGPIALPDGSFGTPGRTAVLTSGGSLPGTPGAETPGAGAPAAPRVAAGAPTQAGFTLLVVTRLTHPGFAPLPDALAPPRRAAQPFAVARNLFVRATAGGIGLWIGVRGGLGVKTLAIPNDGSRHVYPFGAVSLVAQPTPHFVGLSFGWEGRDGRPHDPLPAFGARRVAQPARPVLGTASGWDDAAVERVAFPVARRHPPPRCSRPHPRLDGHQRLGA